MIKIKRLKAQSFVEYSLLIAVGVSVILVMQYYFGRSLQGLLKQNIDNLGGERLSGQQYSPGKWYTGTSVTRIGTTGIEYEGKKGFNVNIAVMQRSQVSKIKGIPNASELPAENLAYQNLVNGEDMALVNQVLGSEVDPGAAIVQSNINNNTSQWSNNAPPQEGQDEDAAEGIDAKAEALVNKQIKQQSVNIEE